MATFLVLAACSCLSVAYILFHWRRNAFGTNGGLDAEPEHGQNNSVDDAEIARPESKRGAIEDREGYVKPGTNSPIQHNDDADDEVP